MRNFLKVGQIDPGPLMQQLYVQPELWDANTIRTKHPGTAHADVSDILVRFNDISNPEKIVDDRTCFEFPAWEKLPALRPIVFNLMHRVEGTQLGRVIITRLPPGKRILPHVDGGAPATFYQRYQCALQSLPGCIFRIGGERVCFASGDVWWINNEIEHEVINNSADDRIVAIVDIRVAP